MIFFSVDVAVLVVASVLITSGIAMGNLAFRAGLGVKRWTLIGLILGPLGYPQALCYEACRWQNSAND